MTHHFSEIDYCAVNAIRVLSIDAIQKANSGHPGAPMGLAPTAYVLFSQMMRHNPRNPAWRNRDRFVLSCGHASMLLYSILHLSGYDVSLDQLKNFRQWHSLTPGHPEAGLTAGVEMTTGPLGQGCAASVGMAIAEANLAARYNTPDHAVVDHYTYVLCSDGDLMEGISHEAASLAGHLKLGKLIWIYDDNRITIDGRTEITLSDDTDRRFAAYGWHCQAVDDGNDLGAIHAAIGAAQNESDRPSIIRLRTTIGYGAPTKQGTPEIHGTPLGADELAAAKKFYQWPSDEPFFVPDDIYRHYRQIQTRGPHYEAEWLRIMTSWKTAHKQLAAEWDRRLNCELPDDWDSDIPTFPADEKGVATRSSSGTVLNKLAPRLPELVGGAADLNASTKTLIKDRPYFSAGNRDGCNIAFGIREHAMAAIQNGLARHGEFRPFGSTFFVFADYMRPSIRLAALMDLPVIYVWTHDSITVGEDGPTHQPVEQLMSLRAIPNLTIIRPADANETAAAWRTALEHSQGPVGLVLTRQNVPTLPETGELAEHGVPMGAYIVSDAGNFYPDLVIIATGYEVHLALAAQAVLADKGYAIQVVSMPSWELFDRQPDDYRNRVIPLECHKIVIECGIGMGWQKYVGLEGVIISLDRFGISAPYKQVYQQLGFSVENVVHQALTLLEN